MVLRIGKEKAILPIYVQQFSKVPSKYAGNIDPWKSNSALHTLPLGAQLCCGLLVEIWFNRIEDKSKSGLGGAMNKVP
jgi:hypothetical protein